VEKLEKIIKTIDGRNILDIGSEHGEFINIIKKFRGFKKITANDIGQ